MNYIWKSDLGTEKVPEFEHIKQMIILSVITLSGFHFTKVDFVSDSLEAAGEAQMTIVVLAFPPKDSWRIRVNFESLKNKLRHLTYLLLSPNLT